LLNSDRLASLYSFSASVVIDYFSSTCIPRQNEITGIGLGSTGYSLKARAVIDGHWRIKRLNRCRFRSKRNKSESAHSD
jgi:hypothetical protein